MLPSAAVHMTYQFPPDVDKLIRDYMAAESFASVDEVLRESSSLRPVCPLPAGD